jgi:D-alanyl-lipoteichoic acid acyltransferase DltB (MBOAT superfamily)
MDIILPIGLSFHTFQSLSYVVEVYWGKQKPEKDFVTYSLYVMYFPQLVAGPIERAANLLYQFHAKYVLPNDTIHSFQNPRMYTYHETWHKLHMQHHAQFQNTQQ